MSLPSFIKGPPGGGRAPGGYFWEQLLGSDGLVRAALTFLPAGEESGAERRGGQRRRPGERSRLGTPFLGSLGCSAPRGAPLPGLLGSPGSPMPAAGARRRGR